MTLCASYFDGMYADSADPWGFTSRWYEARKYAITMAMLPKERYRDAFEPGCSIGVLSDLLAPRCGSLLCCDIAPAAVKAAAERTVAHGHVEVQQRTLPGDWPEGQFDLIVLSEILYYFAGIRPWPGPRPRRSSTAPRRHAARRALAAPGGRIPAQRRRRTRGTGGTAGTGAAGSAHRAGFHRRGLPGRPGTAGVGRGR